MQWASGHKNNKNFICFTRFFSSKFPYYRRRHHRYLLCPLFARICTFVRSRANKNSRREKSWLEKCFVIMWTFQSPPPTLFPELFPENPSLHFFMLNFFDAVDFRKFFFVKRGRKANLNEGMVVVKMTISPDHLLKFE